MRLVAVMALSVNVAASPRAARAEPPESTNAMIGPVLGIRLNGPAANRGILGVEGGVGWAVLRVNVGITRRLGGTFSYFELDPWYVVGASVGAGTDSDGKVHPVLGLWEGAPIVYPDCGDHGWQPMVTLSIGYRYTGVHELYIAPKGGAVYDGGICIH